MKPRNWSPSNVVAVLAALWIGANCAGGCSGAPTTNVLHVTVESGNWYANRVRVLCDTHELGVVRGVELNAVQKKRVWLMGCQTVRLKVEAFNGDAWFTPEIMVQPGDTVSLRIGPTLPLSAYSVR